MNNYIDERYIPYKRPQSAANRYVRVRQGRPLARKTRKEGIVMRSLRLMAGIFLLLLSTFGGDSAVKADKAGISTEKAIKSILCGGGIILALWVMVAFAGNLVNAVTLLPTWSLILIFATIVLVAAGVLKK